MAIASKVQVEDLGGAPTPISIFLDGAEARMHPPRRKGRQVRNQVVSRMGDLVGLGVDPQSSRVVRAGSLVAEVVEGLGSQVALVERVETAASS
jgi:hypothetical protein